MHTIARLIILLPALLFTACSPGDQQIPPTAESRLAETFLEKLRDLDLTYLKVHSAPEVHASLTEKAVGELAANFPSGEPVSTELIGAHVWIDNGVWRQGNFSFEYEFASGWAVAAVNMMQIGGVPLVIGAEVYRTEVSQRDLHEFTLQGKSLAHYAILALACTVPIFVVVTAGFCLRTRGLGRKWLWVIFILFGVSWINVNWTTGQVGYAVLHVTLLGAGAAQSWPTAPWIVGAGLPLGAILFWIKRRKLMSGKGASDDGSDASAVTAT